MYAESNIGMLDKILCKNAQRYTHFGDLHNLEPVHCCGLTVKIVIEVSFD